MPCFLQQFPGSREVRWERWFKSQSKRTCLCAWHSPHLAQMTPCEEGQGLLPILPWRRSVSARGWTRVLASLGPLPSESPVSCVTFMSYRRLHDIPRWSRHSLFLKYPTRLYRQLLLIKYSLCSEGWLKYIYSRNFQEPRQLEHECLTVQLFSSPPH